MNYDTANLPARFIVAIDGPAGSGKSTLAKIMAEKLGAVYIDTGAMYRSITAKTIDDNIDPNDHDAVAKIAASINIEFQRDGATQKTFVNGADFTSRIRQPDVNEMVSVIAAQPDVRSLMVEAQRRMGANGRVVMEGRDVGSHIFPNAEYKFFLIASDETRAERRVKEMREQGMTVDKNAVLANIRERDRIDSTRESSPMIKAPDAVEIDTSKLGIDEVQEKMLQRLILDR